MYKYKYVCILGIVYIHEHMFKKQTTFSFVRSEFMPSIDKIHLHVMVFRNFQQTVQH